MLRKHVYTPKCIDNSGVISVNLLGLFAANDKKISPWLLQVSLRVAWHGWGQVKICDALVVENKIGVRKLSKRSEAKKNPKNHVRFFDTMPKIFCSCSLYYISFAPCSLAFFWPHAPCSLHFWTQFSPLPKTPCGVSFIHLKDVRNLGLRVSHRDSKKSQYFVICL